MPGMKANKKSKAVRPSASGAYFGKDVGYDGMSSYSLDKVGKPSASGYDIGNFESDILGKF